MSAASNGPEDAGPGASPAAGASETPDATGESASAPIACDFDLGDPASLQAVWLTFQRERSAACPVTETPFDLALAHDPVEDDATVAEVQLACGRCGRTVAFSPPDANEVFGWAE